MLYYLLISCVILSSSYGEVAPYFNTPPGSGGVRGTAVCKQVVQSRLHQLIALKRRYDTHQCSLKVAMYEFDDPDLLELLIEAHRMGITVTLLLDKGAYESRRRKIDEVLASQPLPHDTFKIQDKAKKTRMKNSYDYIVSEIRPMFIGNPFGGRGRPKTMHEKFAVFSCMPAAASAVTLSEAASAMPAAKIQKVRKRSDADEKMTSSLAARDDRDDDLEEISEETKNTTVDRASSSEDFEYSVLVGSYNWTDAAAEINYENCVLIDREPALIREFEERLDQIKRMG